MKLVAGSYERFVFGYDVAAISSGAATPSEEPATAAAVAQLTAAFEYGAHLGPVKCLAAAGPVAVSGAADDLVRVYDLDAARDMGALVRHDGAVTCCQLHGGGGGGRPSHLLTGGADAAVCVWDAAAWTPLKTLRGHKAAVNSLAIHPSGRLALSVGRDRALCMWNLVKGSRSLASSLQQEAEIVAFSPQDGEYYSLVTGSVASVRASETGKELHALDHPDRVLCLAQQSDRVLVTGGEGAAVRCWDTADGTCTLEIPGTHSRRIRGLAALPSPSSDGGSTLGLIASASSDGLIRVWDPRMIRGEGATGQRALAEADTRARLTCLAVGGSSSGSGGPERLEEAEVGGRAALPEAANITPVRQKREASGTSAVEEEGRRPTKRRNGKGGGLKRAANGKLDDVAPRLKRRGLGKRAMAAQPPPARRKLVASEDEGRRQSKMRSGKGGSPKLANSDMANSTSLKQQKAGATFERLPAPRLLPAKRKQKAAAAVVPLANGGGS
eukprot:SM000003S11145  [mRNA]  locus=s3:1215668:1218177:+ [translate_table: standard]